MKALLVSCEYATCAVPEAQRVIFEGREDELHSLAGWEAGALNLAQGIAMAFRTPLVHGEITRLLIDLEAGEEDRMGKDAEGVSEHTRERFVERMWKGYRNTLRQRIQEDLHRHDAVVHVLVHTGGVPQGRVNMRVPEGAGLAAEVAMAWANAVREDALDATRMTGGIPGTLIGELLADFPADRYAPIRLEVASEYFLDGKPMRWNACKKALIKSLETLIKG